MTISIGNIVNVVKNIDESVPVDQKYVSQRGIVKKVNEDRPSPITVYFEGIGEDSFWPEELKVIKERMEVEDYREEAYNKGEKIAKELSDALNSMTFDKELINGFVDGITKQHRTLQQSSMRAIMALIKEWSEMAEKGYFDRRNEATVRFCQEIIEKCSINSFPFI